MGQESVRRGAPGKSGRYLMPKSTTALANSRSWVGNPATDLRPTKKLRGMRDYGPRVGAAH